MGTKELRQACHKARRMSTEHPGQVVFVFCNSRTTIGIGTFPIVDSPIQLSLERNKCEWMLREYRDGTVVNSID